MKTLNRIAILAPFAFLLVVSSTASAATFKRVSGGTVHVPSGVLFPARVGAFHFLTTKVYGSGGRDAGAEYDVGVNIRGDVYVYPLGTYGKDFNAELRVQQNAINQANKKVKLVSQSRFQLNQSGRTISGMQVQYELTRPWHQNKMRRCGSQLYLFRDGPWLFQYRFSYPIEQSGLAAKQVADFMRLWQWRAQGRLTRHNQISADASRS